MSTEPSDVSTREDRHLAIQEYPALPVEYVRAGHAWLSATVHSLAAELYPFLKSIPHRAIDEMPDLAEERAIDDEAERDNAPSSTDYRQFAHQHETVISLETALEFDVNAVLVLLYQLADSLGGQQEAALITLMSDAAEASGNVIRMGAVNFWDQFISALEEMDVDFNEEGEDNLSLIVSPELNSQLRTNPPNAEQTAKVRALMQTKREEHRASRSRRRFS